MELFVKLVLHVTIPLPFLYDICILVSVLFFLFCLYLNTLVCDGGLFQDVLRV